MTRQINTSRNKSVNINDISLTDLQSGLTTEYAKSNLKKSAKKVNTNFILAKEVLLAQVKSIFFILLLVSAILSYVLGHTTDAIIFAVLNILNVGIGFLQEFRASKAAKLLEQMVTQSVTVVRDGRIIQIDSKEIINGDIVHLIPGDVIVADMLLRESTDLYIDESVRTGESAPRLHQTRDIVYASTSVSSGTATAQVIAAGDESSLMQYSELLKGVKKDNNFNEFIKKISGSILWVTLGSLTLIGVISVWIQGKYDLSEFVLFSISMLIGVVPESLSLIITLMLAREALILSKQGVIVKNLSALQQLGSIVYLLTDKTGTLTENSVRLAAHVDITGLETAISRILHSEYERGPMEKVFDEASSGLDEDILDHPDTKGRMYTPILTPFSNKQGFSIFDFGDMKVIRGQFNAVFQISSLPGGVAADEIQNKYEEFESKGLRVLAYATSVGSTENYIFNGFTAFEDPLKADAPQSFIDAQDLGVNVNILTGDSARVAQYVASKLDPHLGDENVVVLGERDPSTLTVDEIETYRVYAKCTPEEKLKIIDRHIQLGAVGFMGEGINDALALKRADVGIAVMNASDVAKQSSDILLTENSLEPVAKAVRLSRKAYAHISTYLLCTITGNIGTLFSLTLVALFWKDLPMLPIQILVNNLLTDVPLIALVSDGLNKDEYSKPIVQRARDLFKVIVIFAAISSAFDMAFFFLFKDYSIEVLRTGWFISSVIAELLLIFSLRTKLFLFKGPKLSPILGILVTICAVFTFALPYIPGLADTLSLVRLSASQLGIMVALFILAVVVNEIVKFFLRKKESALRV